MKLPSDSHSGSRATPPAPLKAKPVTKARIPQAAHAVPNAEEAYAHDFRQRLTLRLKAHGLKKTDLVPQEVQASNTGLGRSIVDKFRVSIVNMGGTLYARTRHLATGTFGKHHAALALGPHELKLVAMKSLHTIEKELSQTSEGRSTQAVALKEALQEANYMHRYFDANVEVGVDPSTQKLLMKTPFCGVLSAALAAEGTPKQAMRRSALRQIAEQLARMHRDGLLHNDIKPANIFLQDSGSIKLGDMGLVAAPKDVKEPGTPAFAAPELSWHDLGMELPDSRSDVWSLGMTMADTLHPLRNLVGGKDEIELMLLQKDLIDWQAGVVVGGVLDLARAEASAKTSGIGAYFLEVIKADPALGELIISRMVTDPQSRADIDEVAHRARQLQPEASAADMQAAAFTQGLSQSAHAQALTLALRMRLEDHHGVSAPVPA